MSKDTKDQGKAENQDANKASSFAILDQVSELFRRMPLIDKAVADNLARRERTS